ncbi:RTA1 like protein-domain-containing protein [Amylocarpus encephaloides]|uniref:RTA1 like protein-domain-containing protein n=1 Tax=Amylocarpus encephaloides TaxID=45428 RepID=A0A9P8BZH2_9HELO|nr:RTA1 like protein-domain-containing protein [Amylocarpus encephaloides]
MSVAGEKYIFYHYNPSTAAAAAFAALFGISAGLHSVQLGLRRTWYFIPFVIGGLFEVIGYAARTYSASQSPFWSAGPYSTQSLMLLLAPALFAASIYMVLGRIIRLTDGEQHSVIKAKWLTKIFVTGDAISFLAQSAGGGMLVKADTKKKADMAQNMITGGLGIQVLFFSLFMVVTLIFHIRMRHAPSLRAQSITVPWQQYIIILYVASIFILVRSVFRIAEYVGGSEGVLLSKEFYLYIFDAALMFLTMALFNLRHPCHVVAGKKDLAKD